ncbi:MAG: glycosyltransferase family 9 protein [Prevotella sp.]|nr:glycosyltransferase family 9 protein [Prevotella sp.]
MNILVVRFRQMGDAILTTPLLNTLRLNFPEAHIHYVLNARIAPLFEGHPSIDRIISFSDDELHSTRAYLKKVWRIVHETRYDVIIDKRSTLRSVPFALFSLHTPIRVALKKPYTHLLYTYRVGPVGQQPMIDHILQHLKPLESIKPLVYDRRITLAISQEETAQFGTYLQQQGIDLSRPVMLAGVTAKLEEKTWPKDSMTEVLRRFTERFPQVQVIFNYAPGREEQNARDIYRQLGCPPSVFIDVQAPSSRQLAAMCSYISLYFGNEGGARHIVHAMQRPSLVVCSPYANPQVWIPRDDVAAEAIEHKDASVDNVWQRLEQFTITHI